jgi:hypothetical protein
MKTPIIPCLNHWRVSGSFKNRVYNLGHDFFVEKFSKKPNEPLAFVNQD